MKKRTALFMSLICLSFVFTACSAPADTKSSPTPTAVSTPSALPTQLAALPTPTKKIQPTSTTASTIVYKNTTYGFSFTLPKSWSGYKIVTSKWEGKTSKGSAVTGPMLLIRHPQWSDNKQRQDIPIMVFTLAQWESVQKEDIMIGAAPIPPSELGRNSKYVFALPARYNFAFLTGYEEVEQIISSKPLKGN